MLALAFLGGAGGGAALGFQLRRYSPPADARAAHLDLLAWADWPQIAILFVAVACYFIVALKLFRRVKTLGLWATGFVAHVVIWGWAYYAGYVGPARPDGWPVDLAALAASLLCGLSIAALGRTHLD